MDFSLSDEQSAIQDAARQILLKRSAARSDYKTEAAGEEWFDRRLWSDLAGANLLGIAIGEEYGGSGFGLVELAVLLEEAGRAIARVPLLATVLLGALPIAALGTEEQKQAWLPGMVAGRTVLTAALVEPDPIAPFEVRTEAVPDGAGSWRLTGAKIGVPYGQLADRILVPARVGEQVRLVLVDPLAAGVELRDELATDRSPQSALTLTDVAVTDADVLPAGDGAGGGWLTQRATVGYCAYQLGIAETSLQVTAAYTSQRHQFGRPIGSFQAVAVHAANAYIDVLAMRVTMLQAAWLLAEGRPAERAVAIAKFWAAEAGQRVSATAQHLHGGIGVDLDYPLHRYLLGSKHTELTLGSASWQLGRLAELLDGKQH